MDLMPPPWNVPVWEGRLLDLKLPLDLMLPPDLALPVDLALPLDLKLPPEAGHPPGCSDGSVEQVFAKGMRGCAGAVSSPRVGPARGSTHAVPGPYAIR